MAMNKMINLLLENDVPGVGNAGQRVSFALSPTDVHDATEMPTYLAGYRPFGYRADEMSKVLLVDNTTDKYRTFNSDDAFRRVSVKTSHNAPVPEVDPKSSLETYKTIPRAVGSFVPNVTSAQAGNSYDPKFAAMRRCRRALDLDREMDVLALLGTNTNWDSNVRTALGAGYNWNGGTDSNPIKALQDAIETSWQQVTGIWMNQQLAHAFMRHSEVRNHLRQFYGDGPVSGMSRQIANAGNANVDLEIPGLPPIHVTASKVKNESTENIDYILSSGTCFGVTVVPGTPMDGEEIATTYTFRYKGPSGVGYEVREVEIGYRGASGGVLVIVAMEEISVMTGSNCGFVLTGCYT